MGSACQSPLPSVRSTSHMTETSSYQGCGAVFVSYNSCGGNHCMLCLMPWTDELLPAWACLALRHRSQNYQTGSQLTPLCTASDCRTWPRITSDVFTLRTKHGTDIVAVYVATKKYSDPVILYNHGNAVDLGQMLPFCV